VSFDVDALDSSIMKSTGCVVDNGLFPHEVSAIINNIGDKLIALDVVEFNPKLGTMLEVDASYNSINEILSHVGNHQKEIKRDYYLRFGYDCC
jgi:arginase family enzyme